MYADTMVICYTTFLKFCSGIKMTKIAKLISPLFEFHYNFSFMAKDVRKKLVKCYIEPALLYSKSWDVNKDIRKNSEIHVVSEMNVGKTFWISTIL